jgi:HSP90 family molecular chaperone
MKELETKFKPLTEKMEAKLKQYVSSVKISKQLLHSPCAVVASEYGISGTMEKIYRAQIKQDPTMLNYYKNMKYIFEINPVN